MRSSTLLLAAALCWYCLNSCQTPSNLVTQEQQLGDINNNNGEFDAAIGHYQKALESSMKLGVYRNTEMEAQMCRKVSQAYQTLGKYEDALQFIAYSFSLDSANNNQLGLISDERERGRIFLMKGDLREGIRQLEQSLKLSAGLESSLKDANRNSNAEVQLALANANLVIGHIEEARNFTLAAQDIFSQTLNLEGRAECQLLLGIIMCDKGAPERSIVYIDKSIELARQAGLNSSRQYKALSESMLLTGEYEKALRYAIVAHNKADSSGIRPQMVWTMVGIGDVYRLLGDEEKASGYYYQALELEGKGLESSKSMKASVDWRLGNIFEVRNYLRAEESQLTLGLTYLRIGDIFLRQSQPDSALNNFQLASLAFEKAASKEGVTRARLFMARSFLEAGKNQQAAEALDKAAEANKNPDLNWLILYLQGRYFENINEKVNAKAAYEKAVTEIESFRARFVTEEIKSSYMSSKMEVYDRLIRLLMMDGEKAEALQYAERGKARAFLDLLGSKKVGLKTDKPTALIEREQNISSQITLLKKQYSQSLLNGDIQEDVRASRAVLSEELSRAQEEYNQVLLELKLNDPEYNSLVNVEPANLNEIQSAVGNSVVLLEYWTGAENTILWVIRNNDLQALILPASAAELNNYVEAFRNAIQNQSTDVARLAKKGYEWLIQPAAMLINKEDVIAFAPHGSLHLLPFQALMDREGNYLALTHTLSYTPSATVYSESINKPPVQGKQLLAMALGSLNIGLSTALPGTSREVENISSTWPGSKVLMETAITEDFIKKSAHEYQYLHFATHGFFNEDQPLFSYLLLVPTGMEDGQLTVNEVFGLSLNAQLVSLSACQTGLGKVNAGDELVGLSRAFLYAGSRSVLASLWSVADEATAVLMMSFYSNLKNHNEQEALALAEREVLKRWPEPYYWAPFQLIGNAMPGKK